MSVCPVVLTTNPCTSRELLSYPFVRVGLRWNVHERPHEKAQQTRSEMPDLLALVESLLQVGVLFTSPVYALTSTHLTTSCR